MKKRRRITVMLILQSIDAEGISKSQLVVLQGLTKLRQLANHPLMVDPEYAAWFREI